MDEKTKTHTSLLFDPDSIAKAFAHIESMWPKLTKVQTEDEGTLVGLPYPFIVPSAEATDGFVYKEMYYWDSFFISTGLVSGGHQELAEGMLENILYMIKRFNIAPNASRFYLSARSQPPLLTTYIFNIYDQAEKSEAWLKERMDIAEKEYQQVWTASMQPNLRNVFEGLSRYYDINVLNDLAEAESGWDMTTRFSGKCLSYTPIDLNCLLYRYELDFARVYEIFGDEDTTEVWRAKAAKRAETVTKYMWNEEKGFFFDYNYKKDYQSEVWSLAAYYALWSGLASQEQASRMLRNLERFNYRGGLSTTSSDETRDPRELPKQWAYPNGWAPLHYLSINGLVKYGFSNEAESVARNWINTNLEYFLNFGVFREAYNVVSPLDKPLEGVYPSQTGFGWTNAVFVYLARKFLTAEELLKV